MKKDILSIFTIICTVVLLYMLFIQKNPSDSDYIISSVLAVVIAVLTFLSTRKNIVKNRDNS